MIGLKSDAEQLRFQVVQLLMQKPSAGRPERQTQSTPQRTSKTTYTLIEEKQKNGDLVLAMTWD